MANITIFLMLCSMVIAMRVVHGLAKGPKEVEEWFDKVRHSKQKVTKLHFYFHELQQGQNPTAALVAQANNTENKSATMFGSIYMIDDPITVGPELSSKLVGRAQGLYGLDSLDEVGLLVAVNFVFTDGEHNGSSLSILGHNPIAHKYREMPIIGGSGIFRLARGIVTFNTYFFNFTGGNATVEVNLVATHY